MWEPQLFTTLWASTACYRDSVTFSFTENIGISKTIGKKTYKISSLYVAKMHQGLQTSREEESGKT
jgi:hypothetical protein